MRGRRPWGGVTPTLLIRGPERPLILFPTPGLWVGGGECGPQGYAWGPKELQQ